MSLWWLASLLVAALAVLLAVGASVRLRRETVGVRQSGDAVAVVRRGAAASAEPQGDR